MQGDMLYFPRGVIHEAAATEQFSTHVTISTYQRYAHVDFLQASLPLFLEKCAEDDEHASVEGLGQKLRAGLPLRSVYNFGARQYHSAPEEPEGKAAVARSSLVQELKGLIHAIADSLVRVSPLKSAFVAVVASVTLLLNQLDRLTRAWLHELCL